MADTRTNAGVDNFSIYKKLHLLAEGPIGRSSPARPAICR
jgi:predicted proteasome-type protease